MTPQQKADAMLISYQQNRPAYLRVTADEIKSRRERRDYSRELYRLHVRAKCEELRRELTP